jgi:hypothetical protein
MIRTETILLSIWTLDIYGSKIHVPLVFWIVVNHQISDESAL